MRPGTTITRSETRPARGPRTGTGPLFAVGVTAQADADADPGKPVRNLAEYAARFGGRTGGELMFDTVEFFFKEGGAEAFVAVAATADGPGVTAALATFPKALGPGQVAAPGLTAATVHAELLAHAAANNRIALLDAPNTNVVATLTGATTIAGATVEQLRYGALFAPWVTVPGLTAETTRDIPPSGIVAGRIARNDGQGLSPNQPAAGEFGQSDTGLDVTQAFTDADRNTLNLNGVNILRSMFGGVRVYGYRTLADPSTDANWINLANARTFMAIQAECDAAAERFVFRQLDGRRQTVNEYGGVLTGILIPWWQRGSLYGGTPGDAFRVDVSPAVNTDESLAAGFLKAVLALRVSPFGEEVVLELVKIPTTEAV